MQISDHRPSIVGRVIAWLFAPWDGRRSAATASEPVQDPFPAMLFLPRAAVVSADVVPLRPALETAVLAASPSASVATAETARLLALRLQGVAKRNVAAHLVRPQSRRRHPAGKALPRKVEHALKTYRAPPRVPIVAQRRRPGGSAPLRSEIVTLPKPRRDWRFDMQPTLRAA